MTSRWWTGRACGVDFETDGKEPDDARIIQYATTRISPDLPEPVTVQSLVKPERPIPDEATGVHGITTEHATEFGYGRLDAVRNIVSCLLMGSGIDAAGVDSPVVGHNLAYDLTVLDREMRRVGIGSLGLGDGFSATGIGPVTVRIDGRVVGAFHALDTLVLDKMIDQYRPGSRRLDAVAEHYGVPMAEGSAHDAANDVMASLRIAWRMAVMCSASSGQLFERFADRRRPTDVVSAHTSIAWLSVAEIHARQVAAAARQADGLREHFTRNPDKGDPAGVSGAWPFRPYV